MWFVLPGCYHNEAMQCICLCRAREDHEGDPKQAARFLDNARRTEKEFRPLPACVRLEYAVPDGVTAEMLSAAMDAYRDVLHVCGDSEPNWGDIFGHVWTAMNAAKKSGTGV